MGKEESLGDSAKFLENAHVQIHYLSGKNFVKWKEYYQLLKQQKIEIAFNYLTVCDVTGAMVEKLAGVKTVFNGIRNSRLAPVKTVLEWFAHNFLRIILYTTANRELNISRVWGSARRRPS